MNAHTPGPWSINNWPQARSDITVGAIGTPLIAQIPLRDVSINGQKANANIIAAAPEMLAVLKALIPPEGEEDAPFDWDHYALVLDAAREAVAKAEGTAP